MSEVAPDKWARKPVPQPPAQLKITSYVSVKEANKDQQGPTEGGEEQLGSQDESNPGGKTVGSSCPIDPVDPKGRPMFALTHPFLDDLRL